MANNTCQVCGNPSGNYPICMSCNKLKEKGEVIKCNKCGKWHLTKEKCVTEGPFVVKKDEEKECVACGKPANNGILCFECFKEKELTKKEFQPDRSSQEMKDHYFAQKKSLFRIKKTDYIKKGLIRLIAISEELQLYHNEAYLKERLKEDITSLNKYILDKDKKDEDQVDKEVQRHKFDDEDFRKQWTAENQCDDGHYVRSLSEMQIDNWLYNNGIVHAYEKSVFMESNPDDVVISDFYLPNYKVYIEFWGLDDEKYLERRKYKEELYRKNNLNLISLEKDDVKRLNDILPRRLHDFKN